jgi:two-component system cell cycle sensor histidine kinase/response regulator CckA
MEAKDVDDLRSTLLELEEQVKLLVKTEMRLRRTQAELLRAKETIEEYSRTLEEEVEKRTAELGQAQEQLVQASKMAAIGSLSGGIAHDFNNLLSAILGNAELLELDFAPESEQARLASIIASAARRGSELTAKLLSFARVAPIAVRPLNVNTTVEEVIGLLAHSIDKAISVEADLAPDLWITKADAIQIYQAILNICINAKTAMLPCGGGKLRIETRNRELAPGDVPLDADAHCGRFAVISISDTGVGMDEETLELIFDPFFTTGDMSAGKGLGLTIAYRIVSGHRGFITVDSEKGKGTCFNICLPACDEAEVSQPSSGREGFAPGGRGMILVADDVSEIRDLATSMLSRFGFEVITACDGQETVRLFEQHKDEIRLVMLDLVMPGWSGEKTLEELRRLAPGLKVLIVSGYSTDSANEKLLSLGFDGFIQKPFAMSELSEEIKRIFGRVRYDEQGGSPSEHAAKASWSETGRPQTPRQSSTVSTDD